MTAQYKSITIVNKEGLLMDEPKFRLAPKKYTGETLVVSMRLPKDMLRDIDAAAAKAGRTRNEFLLLSLEFAMERLEITEKTTGGDS